MSCCEFEILEGRGHGVKITREGLGDRVVKKMGMVPYNATYYIYAGP